MPRIWTKLAVIAEKRGFRVLVGELGLLHASKRKYV